MSSCFLNRFSDKPGAVMNRALSKYTFTLAPFWAFFLVIILFGLFFSMACCAAQPESVDEKPARSSPFSASSFPAGESDPGLRVLLVAREEALISSRFFGTIIRLKVREGESFSKGAVLVRFDCRELAADRSVAAATLKLQQTASLANEELHVQKVVGKLENDLARIRVEEAKARAAAYTARMRNCSITAPFAGQVVQLEANEYESLQPGAPIMLIQNPGKLDAELHVPSRWLQWLQPGQVFRTVIEETGRQYQAEINRIGVRVDPVSRTIKVYASISGKHEELLPGMSGYATLAVPASFQEKEPVGYGQEAGRVQ